MITPKDVLKMNYNELIGLTRETNRVPGGVEALKTICRKLLIQSNDKLLEIGTSTGHTALEISRLTDCNIVSIDINKMSLETASIRARNLGITKVQFLQEDATKMSFADNEFDYVFCGNVTSLVSDRKNALREYWRVVRPGGFLIAIPMYYLEEPSNELINQIREAIQVPIQAHYRKDWEEFYIDDETEVYENLHYRFLKCTDQEINDFCKSILSRKHLLELSEETRACLSRRYMEYMHLFNENLSHMGYSILILRRKEDPELNDPELYRSEEIIC